MTKLMGWPDNGEVRQVLFRPSFHRCTDPKGNFGIGDVRMMWVLKHEGWAMTWDVFTGWGLPAEEFKAAAPDCTHPAHRTGYPLHEATGGGVDWHSPVPTYEGQEQAQSACQWLDGPCYLDSGFILGSDLFDLLRIEGDEAVWARMRELMDECRSETIQAESAGSEK